MVAADDLDAGPLGEPGRRLSPPPGQAEGPPDNALDVDERSSVDALLGPPWRGAMVTIFPRANVTQFPTSPGASVTSGVRVSVPVGLPCCSGPRSEVGRQETHGTTRLPM